MSLFFNIADSSFTIAAMFKAIEDMGFFGITGSICVITALAFIIIRAFLELTAVPTVPVIDKKPLEKSKPNTKKIKPIPKPKILKPDLKFTLPASYKIIIFSFLTQALIMFCGFVIHLAKYGKVNFFIWDKIWTSDTVHSFMQLSQSFGFKNGLTSTEMMPLFPFLNGMLGTLFMHQFIISGMLISIISFCMACLLLYKLVIIDYAEQIAAKAVTFLCISPFAFISFFAQPTSLFLSLSLAVLLAIRKKEWGYTGFFGLLAMLCDIRGLLLLIPMLYEFSLQKEKKWSSASPFILLPVGLLLTYMITPLNFFYHASQYHNLLNLTAEFNIKNLLINISPLVSIALLVSGGIPFLMGKIRTSYLLYTLFFVIVSMMTPWTSNRPSDYIVLFPFPIAIALLSYYQNIEKRLYVCSIVFLGFYLFLYVNLHTSF